MRKCISSSYNDYYHSNKKCYYFALLFCLNFEEGGGNFFGIILIWKNPKPDVTSEF